MTNKEKIELRKFCIDKSLQIDKTSMNYTHIEVRAIKPIEDIISDAKKLEKYINGEK